MPDVTGDDEATRKLLETTRTIAVVGASPNPERDSHRIFRFLRGKGYQVVPVNPVATEVDGVACVPDVASARQVLGSVDLVDVFRAADHLPAVVDEAVEAGARAVWGQFTVTHPGAREKALAAGLDLVLDRCILVEHNRLM